MDIMLAGIVVSGGLMIVNTISWVGNTCNYLIYGKKSPQEIETAAEDDMKKATKHMRPNPKRKCPCEREMEYIKKRVKKQLTKENSSEEISDSISNQETYSIANKTLAKITNNTGYDCDITFTNYHGSDLIKSLNAVQTITLTQNQSMDPSQIQATEYFILINIPTNAEFHSDDITIKDIINC